MHVHPAMSPRRLLRLRTLLAPIALGLLLAGCSSPSAPAVPGPLTPPQDFQLQLSSNHVSLSAGGTAQLTVTVKRDAGFSDAVTLSLNGAPAGLTASITPHPGQPDTSDVVLTADPTLVPLGYNVAIDGAAGLETERVDLLATVLEPTEVTVQGRVVDTFRQPIAGAEVRIQGSTATSAADGSFSISGVTRPYDVVVTRSGIDTVDEYLGLTRSNPVLPLLYRQVAPPRSATVAGTLTGEAANTSAQLAEIVYASPEAHGGAVLWTGDGPDYGPFTVTWSGDATTQGRLVGLKWSLGPGGVPDQYLGFGSAALDLSDTQAATGADLQLGAVGTSYLSGTVTVPSGFAVATKDLWLTAGPMTGMLLGIVADTDPAFTFATPEAGLPVGVQAGATSAAGASTVLYRAGLQPNQVVDLVLPAPPTLGAPGATTFDHSTSFQWTALSNTISVLTLTSTAGTSVAVYTDAASATVPPVSVLALPTAGTHYLWTVASWGPYADMDAFTDPAAAPGAFGLAEDVQVATAAPLGILTSSSP